VSNTTAILWSPNTKAKLENDQCSKTSYEKFTKTNQEIKTKIESLINSLKTIREGDQLEASNTLSKRLLELSTTMNKLALKVKLYIKSKGLENSISPRAQSLQPNVHMLQRINKAQEMQNLINEKLNEIEKNLDTVKSTVSIIYDNSLLQLVAKVDALTNSHFPDQDEKVDSNREKKS
jgi:hypothetical protein